jgi:hypothetical protein
MRAFVWDLIRGGHYGQRPRVPRKKAEHTGAPTNAAAYVKKALANSEPSTHGGRADIGWARIDSAYGPLDVAHQILLWRANTGFL